MEILPVNNQFNIGFKSEKAWSGASWRSAPPPAEADLAARLERELRAAKAASAIAAAEVLVPAELLANSARQVLALAEGEPCGSRGAAIIIHVADTRFAAFKIDPDNVTTHEIHLHLQHDASNWTSILPQFIKNLTRGGPIVISPQFTISKKKLFRSQPE